MKWGVMGLKELLKYLNDKQKELEASRKDIPDEMEYWILEEKLELLCEIKVKAESLSNKGVDNHVLDT